eukprot:4873525-Alexandrium_andersonii.AAC.1
MRVVLWRACCGNLRYRAHVWMRNFGGTSKKGTFLYAPVPWIKELANSSIDRSMAWEVDGQSELVTKCPTPLEMLPLFGVFALPAALHDGQDPPRPSRGPLRTPLGPPDQRLRRGLYEAGQR